MDLLSGSILSCWLLIGYLVPNTAFAVISAKSLVDYAQLYLSQYVLFLFVLCSAAILLLHAHKEIRNPNALLIKITIAAYILTYIAVIIYKFHSEKPVAGNLSLLISIFVGLLTSQILSIKKTISVLCTLTMMQAIFVAYHYVRHINIIHSGDIVRSLGTFNNATALYGVFIVAIPLCLSLLISSQTYQRVFYTACLASISVALIMTWCRGGVIGSAVGVIWLCSQYSHLSKRRYMIIVLAGVVLMSVVAVRAHDRTSRDSSNRSIESRQVLFQEGIKLFVKHPFVGSLLSDVQLPVEKKIPYIDQKVTKMSNHPYNQVLFFMDEMGIFGAIFLCAISLGIQQILQKPRQQLGIGLSAAWIAIFVAGLTDTLLGIPSLDADTMNVFAGVLIGLTLNISTSERSR